MHSIDFLLINENCRTGPENEDLWVDLNINQCPVMGSVENPITGTIELRMGERRVLYVEYLNSKEERCEVKGADEFPSKE